MGRLIRRGTGIRGSDPAPRRRPGRVRRWLVRPAAWLLACLAVALLCAWLVLRSDRVQRRLTGILVERIETALDRRVTLESARFELLPPGLTVTGLTLSGDGPSAPDLGSIGRLEVELDILRLWRPAEVALRRVRVEEPRAYLVFRGPEGNNLPKLRRGAAERPRRQLDLRVVIGELAVEGGEVVVDQRTLPLELAARRLDARFFETAARRFEGSLSAAEVTTRLPRAEPYSAEVEVTAALDAEGMEIVSGRISGPDLEAAARGAMEWRGRRELGLDVEGDLDAGLFRRLGYLEEGIDGPARFAGRLVWSPEAWGFRGGLESPRLDLFDRRLDAVAADVSGDRNGVRCEILRGSYGGGAVTGAVSYSRRDEEPAVEVALVVDGVPLERLLADQEIPLEGVFARVSGPFNYTFRPGDSRRGSGWANMTLTPAASPPGGLAVSGTAPLLIDGGVISSEAIRVTGGEQRLLARGSYDLEHRDGRFDYRIDSGRIEELVPLLPIGIDPAEPPPLWLPGAGHGEIEGTLFLRPGQVSSRVQLDLLEFESTGARAARVQGGLLVSAAGLEDLRLELMRPEGAVIVTGEVPFAPAEAGETGGELALGIDAAGWPLAEARPWLPFELPLDGLLSGTLVLAGDPARLAGTLRATVAPVSLEGLAADRLEVDLEFSPEATIFHQVTLSAAAGEMALTGALDQAGERLDLALESAGLDLAREPFAGLLAGDLSGRLSLIGRLAGRPERPRLSVALSGRELSLAGRALGEAGTAALEAGWDGQRLELKGSLLGLVDVAGGGRLDGAGLEAELEVEGSDLRGLAELLTELTPAGLEGGFHGTLHLAAGAGGAEPRSARLELDRLSAVYEGRSLSNLEPVVARYGADGLEIDSLYLGEAKSGSELFLAGRLMGGEGEELDLRLESTLETGWFELLLPGVDLKGGSFDLLATVRGTLAEPQVVGQGEIRKAHVVAAGLPSSLDNLQGVVLLYPRQVVFDSLRADSAGGRLLAGGTVRLGKGSGGFDYRFQISARQLNLPFPEGWQLRGDAEVVLASVEGGRRLQGVVTLDRAYYLEDVEVGLAQTLQGLFQRRRLQVESTDELLVSTQLDLIVSGPGALRVRNNLADLRGDIDLIIRGSLARQAVFGRVDLERGGTLVYSGNEYKVERGQLTFANPVRIEPIIDLVATTEMRDYDLTLNLAGTMDRLNATFASDPPLADLEVLSLLTSGSLASRGAQPGAAGETASVGAEGFLYGQAASLIADRANRLFGLDRFRIDPLTGTSGNLSSARVTVGERLSRDVFATYSYDPSQTEQQILQLEWDVGHGVVLVFTQNGDSSYAVDARVERSF